MVNESLNHQQRKRFEAGELLPLVEQFYTIQGEGYHSGSAAYFIRIGGCDVGCSWCDTKFSWNPDLHPLVETEEIVRKAVASGASDLVVTGGEPLIYNLDMLTRRLKEEGFTRYLETSGAWPLRGEFDWICLSPKKNKPPLPEIFPLTDELKVIVQTPDDLAWAEQNVARVGNNCKRYLQPEWSQFKKIIPVITDYVMAHPEWKISLQVHKFMHLP